MEKSTKPLIKCSEIREILKSQPPNELWIKYFCWVKTLLPFCEAALQKIASLSNSEAEKIEKHLFSLQNAFDLMDNWRFKRIKYVKSRRKEIDSAISFLRNTAVLPNISPFRFAPVCRNTASILRSCLHISTEGYGDTQLPTVMAQGIYDLASIKTLFPIHISKLVTFLPTGMSIHGIGADLDNYHLMLENAAEKLGLENELIELNKTVLDIWENFDNAKSWEISDLVWNQK